MTVERRALVAGFSNADLANTLAYARVESSLPLALPAFTKMSLAEQRTQLRKNGPLTGAIGLARNTADAIEFVAAQSAGTQAVGYHIDTGGGLHAGLRSNLMMQSIVEWQMRQNIFRIGHPGCAPGGGQPDECNNAPIYQPINPPPF